MPSTTQSSLVFCILFHSVVRYFMRKHRRKKNGFEEKGTLSIISIVSLCIELQCKTGDIAKNIKQDKTKAKLPTYFQAMYDSSVDYTCRIHEHALRINTNFWIIISALLHSLISSDN